MKFDELKIGMSAETTKTITETDVVLFAGLSTDINPLHINEEYAKTTVFGSRIAHGILVSGLISATLANKLPGPGCIYLGQDLKFTAPVRINDTVTARVEITELREDKKIVTLSTTCTNQRGEVVIKGSAVLKHNV
ncbi:MAG: MaoC family dehydratase [Clostridia bacterium]|nr:MaoC family dehydratase [Clostridia bacterium]